LELGFRHDHSVIGRRDNLTQAQLIRWGGKVHVQNEPCPIEDFRPLLPENEVVRFPVEDQHLLAAPFQLPRQPACDLMPAPGPHFPKLYDRNVPLQLQARPIGGVKAPVYNDRANPMPGQVVGVNRGTQREDVEQASFMKPEDVPQEAQPCSPIAQDCRQHPCHGSLQAPSGVIAVQLRPR